MMMISAPSSRAGICSSLISASRLMRTAGSPALFCRSKISASDPLASTKTPRTEISVGCDPGWCPAHFLFEHDLFGKPVPTFPDHALGSDARERQHGVHQNVGARRAVGLGGVLELVVADAILAGDEYHRGRNLRIQ